MSEIGSWWVKGYGARAGEEVRGGFYANFLRSDGRPLGGKLYVTSERILFCPHLIDAFFGGARAMILLEDVEGVDLVDPSTEGTGEEGVVGGGTQKRIRVRVRNGEDSYFVVNDLDGAAAVIEESTASLANAESAR